MTSLPRFSVQNPVLVNLLMWSILIGGGYSAVTLLREMFPEITPNAVMVTTVYPGATPAEVEKGIAVKIEEVIKDLEEIDEINTTIGEGFSSIMILLRNDVDDVDQVVSDVKAAIDTIRREDFPEDAEETRVTKFEPMLPVINVSYFGDLDEETLKDTGRRLRDELLMIPGITEVVLQGTRPDEISVEVDPAQLNRYKLSLPSIADAIARANLDLPGGQLKTSGANVSIRTLGEQDQAQPIGRTIVRSDPSGKVVRLDEIAQVIDGFQDSDLESRFNAKPSVGVTVLKTPRQDAIDIANKVKALVAGKMHQPLDRDWWASLKFRLGIRDQVEKVYERAWNEPYPTGGALKTSTNLARFIEGRLDLLKRNGLWGLLFVFLSLLLFLNWRVAFWVGMGLLLALIGTLIVMRVMGISLNLISAFGLIVVLGLLVDDAIIVGEHVFTRVEEGMEPRLAAVRGAEAVTWPVLCAIVTTIVAFAPLLFIEGQIGDFMGVLPVIVICALSVSLFEALSILPSHLAEWLKPVRPIADIERTPGSQRWFERVRSTQAFVLKTVLLGGYERLLRKATTYRYVTLAALTGVMIVAVGMIAGGRVPIVFVQKMDSETILANLKMPVGVPVHETDSAISVVEQATVDLGSELDSLYTLIGTQYSEDMVGVSAGSHLGQLIVELTGIEERDRNSEEILRELRAKTRDIPGVNALKFSAMHGGPGGAAIQVEISGESLTELVEVSGKLKEELAGYAGVFDIDDDFDAGRREVQIELLDSARALGFTTRSLATQVRGAFYGIEARKVQRDREDVRIMVRYPESARRRLSDIESMWVASGAGRLVPFREVAKIQEGRSFASIKRKDQKRTVTITADVDQTVGNARQVNVELAAAFPQLEREFPGTTFEFGGQAREFAKAFGSLWRDFIVAAALVFVLLAALFKSYVQPLIVMTAIPFGLIGAVAGHFVMGYPLTIMSIIGLVALTGIVVNDALILVDWINHRRAEGMETHEAVVQGGRARMRAIMLTSITTILGLAPLLLETSFQARFLIPMGISIAAGVAFATVLTLLMIPALYLVVEDGKSVFVRLASFLGFSVTPVEPVLGERVRPTRPRFGRIPVPRKNPLVDTGEHGATHRPRR